jgi:hypothetical protein
MPIVTGSPSHLHPIDHRPPARQIGRPGRDAESITHDRVEPAFVQHHRHLVDAVGVEGVDDGLGGHVAEERDLAAGRLLDRAIRSQHDHVGMDALRPQFGNRVLGRLGLELFGRADVGNEGDMQVEGVLTPDVVAELPDGLEEGKALDVADGASHLGDDDIGTALLPHPGDAGFDLVGDVRDHLDRVTQIVAPAFLLDDRQVDRPGGDIRRPAQVGADEPLVVAQVEVGLPTIVGHEHLAMLEGVHRSGVHVDVRIQLLNDHPEPSGLEETSERCRRDALSEARDHAPGHEHVLGTGRPCLEIERLHAVRSAGGTVGEEIVRHGRPR